MPVDGLEHYDRVIHDDADAQHQREHRENVHRVAQGVENRKCADNRDRDCHDGNERGPDVAQENEDDQHDESKRNRQRAPYFRDRLFDIYAGVICDVEIAALRQRGLDGGNFGADALGDRDGVGFGLFDHAEENARLAGGAGDGAVILGPRFRAADVPHPHEGGAFSAHDQIVEFLSSLKFAPCLDGHLAVQVLNTAAGQFDVLLAQRPLDIQHRDLARGHFFRIEP